MALSGGDVIWVREILSDRWDLAIYELADAGALVVLDGEVKVGLHRTVSPVADERVRVSVFATVEPRLLDAKTANRDVSRGKRAIAAALQADPRLTDLFHRFGVHREYVFDYGHGGVVVGTINEAWTVTLR